MAEGGIFVFKNEAVALRILEDFRMGLITRKEAAGLLVCSERAAKIFMKCDWSEGTKSLINVSRE